MSESNNTKSPQASAYEKLYDQPLSYQEQAEMRFNLVRYIELLIVLDRQHKEWLAAHPEQTKDKRSTGNK